MTNKKLNLSKEDVRDYCHKNQYATMMFYTASDDYVASRCCILNGLFTGFVLACQAIEKLLKSFIFLETGRRTKVRGNDKHNPFKLKEELKKTKDYKLDKFDDLLNRLYGHYQSRYYDNKDSSKVKSGTEIDEIDELWVHLLEIIPFPDEVRYRLKFFAELFDDNTKKHWIGTYFWATKNNKYLLFKINSMERRYKEVLYHLYPNLKKLKI